MSEEKAVLKIKGNEYKLRFTIGFWKRLQDIGVTQDNFQNRLNEDFSGVASKAVLEGINFGSNEGLPLVTIEDIENELDRSVVDVIEQAIINGMTKQEKRLVEIAKNKMLGKFEELESEDPTKKKSQ